MAKRTLKAKGKVAPLATPLANVPALVVAPTPTRTRAAAYDPKAPITIVTGEGARNVRENQAPWRAIVALRSLGAKATVETYVAAFAPLCEAKPLPGRGGQPGRVQAVAILRWLEGQGALVVGSPKAK